MVGYARDRGKQCVGLLFDLSFILLLLVLVVLVLVLVLLGVLC